MDQKKISLIATEENKKLPILIIDKKGTLGSQFATLLSDQFLVILVSGHQQTFTQNTIHVSYKNKIPVIPDNRYSSMFVFYNGESEVLDLLPAIIKKANAVNARVLLITNLVHSSHKLQLLLSEHQYREVQTIIYGEVFHQEDNTDNMVNFLLHQMHKSGSIVIPHDVGRLYPILLGDVFNAIISVAFATVMKHKTILVFPKGGVTEISIARMLKKKNPLLKIDFKRYKGKAPTYYIPHTGTYFYEDYPLEKKLQKVGETYKISVHETAHKKTKHHTRGTKTNLSLGMFITVLLLSILLPIVATVFIGLLGLGSLYLSASQIEKRQISQTIPYAVFAKSALGTATTIGESLIYVDVFFKVPKERILKQYKVAHTLAATEAEMLVAINSMTAVFDGKSDNPKKDFLGALAVVKNSLITLQQMSAEGQLPIDVSAKLLSFEKVLSPLENTIDAMPYLLGFEGQRTYLLLFQNNMELRPGGGFIGSYGMVKINNGKILSFKIFDVYDADGKLTTHIEPPFALRRYLGSSHWFLRDSNFAIDFPTNAAQAQTFLKLETGEKVDGVMAVDTNFLKNILAAIGPVEVLDYKEVVDQNNFYLLVQDHAEKNFFPGSTQKKDFMRSLLAALQLKLAEGKNISYTALLGAMDISIQEKHLFFAFSDEATQKLFTVNNLSSSLWDGRDRNASTFLDFFGVIDANLGLNKTNYYLKREVDQKIVIQNNGDIETIATVTYTNTSKKDSPYGGEYKNYVRFILPAGTNVKTIKIDDVTRETIDPIIDPTVFTAKGFLPPTELEVEKGVEQGKTTFGFLVAVPIGQTRKVSITYLVEHAVNLQAAEFAYDLKLFKQPGTDIDPYSLTIQYPSTYQLFDKDQRLNDVGGKLVYSGILNEDINMKVQFSKK